MGVLQDFLGRPTAKTDWIPPDGENWLLRYYYLFRLRAFESCKNIRIRLALPADAGDNRMDKSKPLSKRERTEATFLFDVVIAHLAFSSAKTAEDRESARGYFEQAVATLYCFIKNPERC